MVAHPSSPSASDREALIGALKRGEDDAYRRLMAEMGPSLLSVARRFTRCEDDAKEVFQEAIIQAFRKIDAYEGRGALEGWLRRIVVNVALMRIRKEKTQNESSLDELLPQFDERDCRIEPRLPPLPSPETVLASERARRLVRDAIDRLPMTHRTILVLRDIEGYSTQEAADALGIERGATKVRLHRARAALKKLLEPLRDGCDLA